FFIFMLHLPPMSTLFPYTTLFRSVPKGQEYTYSVRAQGRLSSPEEFGEIVVRESPGGAVVRLKDVARVELGAQNNLSEFFGRARSEEHTSELQSRGHLVCRLLLEK